MQPKHKPMNEVQATADSLERGFKVPNLGAHMSIAGGIHLAFDRLKEIQGNAMQIFTANHRQWRSGRTQPRAIELFKSRWEQTGGIPVASHDIYLINLAARDELILSKSVTAFAEELKRCAALGIKYLIMHPGAHLGEGAGTGSHFFCEKPGSRD